MPTCGISDEKIKETITTYQRVGRGTAQVLQHLIFCFTQQKGLYLTLVINPLSHSEALVNRPRKTARVVHHHRVKGGVPSRMGRLESRTKVISRFVHHWGY